MEEINNASVTCFLADKPDAAVETAGDITIVRYERNSIPCAAAFGPKSKRAKFQHGFIHPQVRETYIENYLGQIERRKQEKEAYKAEEAEKGRLLLQNTKPGDIFISVWGWEQTNVDYYQVIAVKSASFVIREVKSAYEPTGDMSGHKTPIKNCFIGEPFTVRVNSGSLRINSFSRAYPWDGKKQHSTSYA